MKSKIQSKLSELEAKQNQVIALINKCKVDLDKAEDEAEKNRIMEILQKGTQLMFMISNEASALNAVLSDFVLPLGSDLQSIDGETIELSPRYYELTKQIKKEE